MIPQAHSPTKTVVIASLALVVLTLGTAPTVAQDLAACAGIYEGTITRVHDDAIQPRVLEAEILPDGRGCVTFGGQGSFRIQESGGVIPVEHVGGDSPFSGDISSGNGCQGGGTAIVSATFDFETCTLRFVQDPTPNLAPGGFSFVLAPVGRVPGPPEEDDCTNDSEIFIWFGNDGDEFLNEDSWDTLEAPTATDRVLFTNNQMAGGMVRFDLNVTNDSLSVSGDTVNLDLNAANYTLTGDCLVPSLSVGVDQEFTTIPGLLGLFNYSISDAKVKTRGITVGDSEFDRGSLSLEDMITLEDSLSCEIGFEGEGRLEIGNSLLATTGDFDVAAKAGSTGDVAIAHTPDSSDDILALFNLRVDGVTSIGGEGTATMALGQNASVLTADLIIGQKGNSDGTVTLNGTDIDGNVLPVDERPRITIGGDATIGDEGFGMLTIKSASGLQTDATAGAELRRMVIGNRSSSDGTVEVDGAGSLWFTEELVVGQEGNADLFIGNGGRVFSKVGLVGLLTGSVGNVSVTGFSFWNVEGAVFVGTLGKGTVGVDPGSDVNTSQFILGPEGRLEVLAVRITDSSGTGPEKAGIRQQQIDQPGTGLTTQSLTLQEGSELVTESVTLDPGGQLAGDGEFDFDLTNPGELAPGVDECTAGPFVINGDYTQQAEGRLLMKLGGPEQGIDHDVLFVNGNVTLSGSLSVRAINNFRPQAGDVFEILAADSVTGEFDSIEGSGQYEPTYEADRVLLTVIASPAEVAVTCEEADNQGPPRSGFGQGSRSAGGPCGTGILPLLPLILCGLGLLGRSGCGRI